MEKGTETEIDFAVKRPREPLRMVWPRRTTRAMLERHAAEVLALKSDLLETGDLGNLTGSPGQVCVELTKAHIALMRAARLLQEEDPL